MNPFEEIYYPILSKKPEQHPEIEKCPAVLAEREGKTTTEIIDACRKCYAQLMQPKNSKSKGA